MARIESNQAANGSCNAENRTSRLSRRFAAAAASAIVVLLTGCAPGMMPSEDDGLLGLITDANAAYATADAETATVDGAVTEAGGYEMFDLGSAATGDEWTVSMREAASASSAFIVALFDADYTLLNRGIVAADLPLRHVVRRETAAVYLGVMAPAGTKGGEFRLVARRRVGVAVPTPAAQVVWLNFGTGEDVQVRRREAMSFDAFDAAMLADDYAGQTQTVKDAIVSSMREDYAAYNVTILSSDDGAEPVGPHTTVQFGGEAGGLLGLADNVDRYNQEQTQTAVVYVNNFAPFAAMELDAEEMGMMIGNVASHELGHLLGLFHTSRRDGLMDATGSQWDLAGDQAFARGELLAQVFPVGFEDTPQLLADTVGLRAGFELADEYEPGTKSEQRALLREVLEDDVLLGCGLCQELD